jgi:DNA-binding beta-propeller fold protein YncE
MSFSRLARRMALFVLVISPALATEVLVAPVVARPGEGGHIMVYLEVPGQIEDATRLTLASLILAGEGGDLEVAVQGQELAAADLAGNQKLLGVVAAPAGSLREVQLGIAAVAGRAGIAPIQADLDGKVFTYNVDFTPGLNRNQCLFLVWQPQALPAKIADYRPQLSVRQGDWPPLGSALFVSCPTTDAILVIDTDSQRVEGALNIGDGPRGMAYSPLTQMVYVALKEDAAIAVVQAASCRWDHTIALNFGDEPTRVALAANQTDLLVLNSGSRTLVGVSILTHQELFRIPVGNRPRSMAQDPETGLVYVACEGEGEIQVIDPAGPGHQGAVALTTSPAEILIDDRSRALVVSSSSQRKLFGWILATGASFPPLNLCSNASSLGFDPRSGQVYCGIADCRSISVFQPDNGLEFSGIRLPAAPGLMTFDARFGVLAVALPEQGRVALISVIKGELIQEFEAGPDVYDVLIP